MEMMMVSCDVDGLVDGAWDNVGPWVIVGADDGAIEHDFFFIAFDFLLELLLLDFLDYFVLFLIVGDFVPDGDLDAIGDDGDNDFLFDCATVLLLP